MKKKSEKGPQRGKGRERSAGQKVLRKYEKRIKREEKDIWEVKDGRKVVVKEKGQK